MHGLLPKCRYHSHVPSLDACLDGNEGTSRCELVLPLLLFVFFKTAQERNTHGCSVFPTPTPVKIPYPICFPTPEDSSRVENNPSPTAQITQPKRMLSRYLPTQWTTRPERVLLTATRVRMDTISANRGGGHTLQKRNGQ